MEKYRILKTYSPLDDKWIYSLQRMFVTKMLFRKPKIEWEHVGWSGICTNDTDIAIKWHRLYKANIFEKDPATGVVTMIYSEPMNIVAEGMPKPFNPVRPVPPSDRKIKEGGI